MDVFRLVILCGILCVISMTLTWLYAIKINNYSIVDIVWSYNFPLIAILLLLCADGFSARKYLIGIPVILWGFRLGTHLLVRIRTHLDKEDGRYLTLREEWAGNIKSKFFSFYMMQAASNVFLAIPFIITASNPSKEIHWMEWVGLVIWTLALLGESTADRQLANFKKNPLNKGFVCKVGLWSWSRHPNYFFEFVIWISYAVIASTSPYGLIAWIAPASILYLLLKVTGIPMTEEQSIKSKGQAYIDYQNSTSKFIPLPPTK